MNKLTTTIELFQIHQSFKVRFSMVIKPDDIDVQKNPYKQKHVINKYLYDGNTSIKINAYPFITIDISTKKDKQEGWNSNQYFSLGRRELFIMICKLTNLYNKFKSINNLFYIDNNSDELVVNQELAISNEESFIACGNKVINMQACVVDVTTESGHNIKYEGIVLYVNKFDFYSYLTYAEMEYLLYELKRIDISKLLMDAINTTLLSESIETQKLEKKVKPPIAEVSDDEIIDIKPSITIKDSNIIPNI